MNRILYVFAIAVVMLASCGESMEKKAEVLLNEARNAYMAQDYGRSKGLLDSLKVAYPKAFKARRAALQLRRDVEMGEQLRSLRFCEEKLETLAARRDSLLPVFVLEKDGRYQDVGNYMIPSQTVKNNLNNTYLRAQVDEHGIVVLSSVYRGKALGHTGVRVSSGDSYAECEAPFNKYTSKHLGVTTERVDFRYGQDGGVMDFIASCDSPVTVCLKGKSEYKYTLRDVDAAAIADVLLLADVLRAITETTEMRDEALRHINFIERSNERHKNVESDTVAMSAD